MNTRQPYKPGPSQIARYKANTMQLLDEEAAYKMMFGQFPAVTNTDCVVDTARIPQETIDAIQKQFGSALKFDGDKLPLHLLSTEAMNQTAAVLKFGAQKYAEHNWRKGFAWSRPLSAAMRHITAFNNGEDTDPESGLSHLAHAACCIMFLLEFEKTHPHLDDRYKPDLPQTN
jgi:hypothetical protein